MSRDLRMVPLVVGVWTVSLLCAFVPAAVVWCAGLCGIGAVLVAVAMLRGTEHGRTAGLGLLVVMLAAGAAVCGAASAAAPGRGAASFWDGRVVEATGEITSSASIGRDGRLWVEVQLSAIGSPGRGESASAPVRIGVEPGEGFDLGTTIRVAGEAAGTDAGERSALVIYASDVAIVRSASGMFALAADARHAFVERSLRLPEPGAGLLPGLAVGDTRAVSTELNDDMRTSGLSHLTAVSGANCAIVVGAVFLVAAFCGAGRPLRVVLAALALAAFVVLVTPEPSVIRASVMAGVAMLSVLVGRPSAGAGLLSLTATGILLVDPWLSSTPGFALSVAASGALIMLAPPLARGMSRWMPGPLALAVAVPLAAQIVCGPIIALFSEQQSLVGLAVNLLAAPAAPIVTVIGLLACLAAPLPFLADLLAASAWLPASWIAATATSTARLPFAQITMASGVLSAAVVAVVSAALAVVLVGSRRGSSVVRVVASAIMSVVVALGAAQGLLAGPLATATSPDGWAVAACDVGQGDALVVREQHEVMLIDTGPEPGPLEECLRVLGIDRIDLLVLTHFDLDHVGGVDAVQGRVGAVLHGPTSERADEATLRRLAEGGATVTSASAGLRGELGAARWQVLWPQRESVAFPPGNDASVVVEIEGGGVPRSLFLGDLSAEAQRMLARTAKLRGDFAVVKVAHHGSADQDPDMYRALDPAVALFSAGRDNDYGHPRSETLALLNATGARVLRTDEEGNLLVGMHDGALELWTEHPPP